MIDWRPLTLGAICEEAGGSIQTGPFGSQLHASDYVAVGTPCVMPKDIGDNRIVTDTIARVAPNDLQRLRRYQLLEGDIVYSRRGDVERRALVRAENEGWLCGTGCLRVRIGDNSVHDPAFVSYALGLEKTKLWIVRHAVGATMLNLNTEILSNVPLSAPPVSEQKAIVAVLGALDDKIAANMAHGHNAHELGQTLYELASRSWNFEPLANAMHSLLGATPARSNPSFWNGAVPWASAKDIAAAPLGTLLTTSESISMLAAESTKARPRPVGTVILTARGTVGAVARLGAPAAFNQSCYGFEPGVLPPAVLYFAIRAVAQQARSLVHGSVFDTITRSTFEHTLVPSAESAGIAEVEAELSSLLAIIDTVVRENGVLKETRDTLLPLLMSGKVRVKDVEKQVEEVV